MNGFGHDEDIPKGQRATVATPVQSSKNTAALDASGSGHLFQRVGIRYQPERSGFLKEMYNILVSHNNLQF